MDSLRPLFVLNTIFLVLCFLEGIWSMEARTEYATVQWEGGTASMCDNCSQANETTMMPLFACNEERWGEFGDKPGNWSDGKKQFVVNVTDAELVVQVNVTLWGRFHCSFISIGQAIPTIFSVSVQGIPLTTNPLEFPGCPFCDYCGTCDECAVPLELSGMYYAPPAGWPQWNYTGENNFEIAVEQSVVCMSQAILSIAIVPRGSTTGGTTTSNPGDGDMDAPIWVVALILGLGICCVLGAIILFILAGRKWKGANGKSGMSLVVNGYGATDNETRISTNSGPQYYEKQMPYDEITLGPRIGKGSYGEVFRGTWRGTEVAIKKLPYYFSEIGDSEEQDTFLQDFLRETELMKTLRHPNIVQLYAATSYPEVCMVMEYMHRGSLYTILHSPSIHLSWDLLKRIMLDAAKGMTYLHNSKPVIIHRDLKSHNLLIDQHWRTKVSDFGLSRMVEMSAMATMTSCGTPSWTAPEVLRGEKYTEKCDVYAYGIVLWECVTRENPHHGLPHFQIVFQVGTQGLRPKIPPDCPHAWARLITDCWTENPDERPTFEEIISRLEKF